MCPHGHIIIYNYVIFLMSTWAYIYVSNILLNSAGSKRPFKSFISLQQLISDKQMRVTQKIVQRMLQIGDKEEEGF